MALPQATPKKEAPAHIITHDLPHNPFDALAIETVQLIAESIESDQSLCAFQRSCRSAHDAIEGDNFSFWRRRFLAHFEPTGWSQKENVKYQTAYQQRRAILKNGAQFLTGRLRKEKDCLEVVKELITSAYCDGRDSPAADLIHHSKPQSNNLERLITFLLSTDLLQTIFKPLPCHLRNRYALSQLRPQPLLNTIRVLCAPILLSQNEHLIRDHYGFPDTQLAVYSPTIQQPFFGGPNGLDINMDFVLHNLSFWRYHMVRKAEHTLFPALAALTEGERPQWWRSQLSQGCKPLGQYWKGSYSYLLDDMLEGIRDPQRKADEYAQFQDALAGEDDAFAFQDMDIQSMHGKKFAWHPWFEQHVKALTPPTPSAPGGPRTRAQKKGGFCGTPAEIAKFAPLPFRLQGSGSDVDQSFCADGWVNPLPAQQGIPGWQRFTMMKYHARELTAEDPEPEEGSVPVDWGQDVWAYEGVVLPGGRIIVGRWWRPDEDAVREGWEYSGPFVMWCVDGAEGYQVRGKEEEMEV